MNKKSLVRILTAGVITVTGAVSWVGYNLYQRFLQLKEVQEQLLAEHEEALQLNAATDISDALRDARKNPAERQKYLDELIDINQLPFCEGVVYDHDGSKVIDYGKAQVKKLDLDDPVYRPFLEKMVQQIAGFQLPLTPEVRERLREQMVNNMEGFRQRSTNTNYVAIVFTPVIMRGRGYKAKIFVSKIMFEGDHLLPTDDEIKWGLREHEYRHVLQHTLGMNADLVLPDHISYHLLREDIHSETATYVQELDAEQQALQATQKGNYHLRTAWLRGNVKLYIMHIGLLTSQYVLSHGVERTYIGAALEGTKGFNLEGIAGGNTVK